MKSRQLVGGTGLAEGAGKTHSAPGVEPSQQGSPDRGQGVCGGQGAGSGGVQAALSQGAELRMGAGNRSHRPGTGAACPSALGSGWVRMGAASSLGSEGRALWL